MADTYSDLIQQFGSGASDDKKSVVTPHADLINEFGSDKSDAVYKLPDNVPKPNQAPSVNVPLGSRTQQLPADLWGGLKTDYLDNVKNASDELHSGLNDLQTGKVATGAAKTLLSIPEGIGAGLGITSAIHGVGKAATELTGDPTFGSKLELSTLALPVGNKTGTLIKNTMPTNRALDKVVDLIGPENLPQAVDLLKANPRLSIIDVAPGMKSAGQGLAVTPGSHQKQLLDFAEKRSATAKDAVENIYTDTMGAPVNVKDKLDTLKQNIKDIGTKEINPVIASANPVNITPVVQSIDNILKPGVNSVISAGEPLPSIGLKKELQNLRPLLTDDQSIRTSADELHKIQSNLRAQAEGMMDSANGQDRLIGRGLMNVRNQIVDAIDTATGGAYKPTLAKYRDANQIDEAFNKGFSITQNRKGQWSDRPEFWNDWVKNASPEELQAAREGARIAADQQINGMRFGAKKGTDIPEVQFNRDKLNLLFPKEEVNTMATQLQHEKMIAESNSDLFKGSQTARRMAGKEAIEPRPDYKPDITSALAPIAELGMNAMTGIPVVGSGSIIGYNVARKLMTKAGQKLDRATNNKMVDFITAEGKSRDELIDALSSRIPQVKPTMLQRMQNYSLPVLPP